jgi:CRP-like cAMP-binding protein
MEKLFREISTLTSVQGVYLLSKHGEVLFESDQRWLSAGDGFSLIKKTIRSIDGSKMAMFSFENGRFCLYRTKIGYLLVGMGLSASDNQVLDGCAAVMMKLTDPESRKETLLQALAESRQTLKPQIVKALVPYGDAEVAESLVRLFAEQGRFDAEIRNRLILFICQALGYCPSEQGLQSLQDFLKNPEDLGDDILQAARMSIQQIEVSLSTERNNRTRAESTHHTSTSPQNMQKNDRGSDVPITGLPEEQQIRDFLSKGEKEKGRQLLQEIIAATVRQRRFADAENLREWLIEIDPMALGDIIKAAEIIESAKSASIDKGYRVVWSALADALDPNEFSTLYHSLEHQQFAKGEIIVKQGSRQSALFFINSGRVELFFQEHGKEVSVNTLGPGEILGAGTFFEASVWTINARSLGAELSSLKLDKIQQWQKNFPALESNLNDFCIRFTIPYKSFRKLGRDRRIFERVRITGRVAMALLDKGGKDTGIGAKGDLFDISAGGISFFLRISQKKNARLLYGRKARVTMASAVSPMFTITGDILAVRSQPVVGNEYSVHMRFTRVLEPHELKNIIAADKEQS